MKKALIVALILVVILPQLLLSILPAGEIQGETISTVAGIPAEKNVIPEIRILDGEEIRLMQLDDYVACVVFGEMPASFEEDALKAQAVAVRTYTLHSIMGGNKHNDAHVCTEAACCQAFVHLKNDAEDRESVEKVKRAVLDTTGEVITYHGNLIDATYFSCSGGKTEDAVAVWGANVPYLRSVDSPGEENAGNFESQKTLSFQSFKSELGLPVSLSVTQDAIRIMRTNGGGVESLYISGYEYSGVEVRSLLALPSTNFSVTVLNDEIVIATKGNGHRVGMSQYGAEAMAVEGKDYKEILSHYYVGTALEKYTEQQINAIFDKG